MSAFLLCFMKKHVIIIYVCVFVMRYEKAPFMKKHIIMVCARDFLHYGFWRAFMKKHLL